MLCLIDDNLEIHNMDITSSCTALDFFFFDESDEHEHNSKCQEKKSLKRKTHTYNLQQKVVLVKKEI